MQRSTFFFIIAALVLLAVYFTVIQPRTGGDVQKLPPEAVAVKNADLKRWSNKREAASTIASLALRAKLKDAALLAYRFANHRLQPSWKNVAMHRAVNDTFKDYAQQLSNSNASKPINWTCKETCCFAAVSSRDVNEFEVQQIVPPGTINTWNLKSALSELVLYGENPILYSDKLPLFDRRVIPCLQPGTVLWVDSYALRIFVHETLPRLQKANIPFVLVTGDGDAPSDWPEYARQLLDSDLVLQWFGSNPAPFPDRSNNGKRAIVFQHKFVPLPIGSNWEWATVFGRIVIERRKRAAEMQSNASTSKNNSTRLRIQLLISFSAGSHKDRETLWADTCAPYPMPLRRDVEFATIHDEHTSANFTVNTTCGYMRREGIPAAARQILVECSPFLPAAAGRIQQQQQSCITFVASPQGYGIDCFRTWEALMLGAIPIVKRQQGPLDNILTEFAVLVDDWSELNSTRLAAEAPRFLQMSRDVVMMKTLHEELLSVSSWQQKVRSFRADPSKRFLFRVI